MLGTANALTMSGIASRFAFGQEAKKPRFLIVFGAFGGASLIDGPMAIRASESANADGLNVYPDALVSAGSASAIRAIDQDIKALGPIPYGFAAKQSEFVKKHQANMMVVTATTTSVNHGIAQRRAVTGNEAWQGRTLQELVATEYGQKALIPNAHLMNGAMFTERGSDASLPTGAFGETIADPLLFPLALHGSRGVVGQDNADVVAAARRFRDDQLRKASRFSKVFDNAPALKRWRALRGVQGQVETADLISKLMVVADGEKFPLAKNGLASSPAAAKVRAQFPNYDQDPLQAQAALAYLMLTQGASVTATIGPTQNFVYTGKPIGPDGQLEAEQVRDLPIGFDYSHTSHRGGQAFMWSQMYRTIDGLIALLKSTEFEGGQSYWDRTMIYCATDFGRTKNRPAGADDFGSGHDLNNGFLVVSPLVNGGKVLGGIDPNTALTYGFNLSTGAPDKGRTTSEKEVFAGLLGALGVNTSGSGLPDVPAMRKV
jgi:hypothetical protein